MRTPNALVGTLPLPHQGRRVLWSRRRTRTAFLWLPLLLVLWITACTHDLAARRETAAALAAHAGMQPVTFDGGRFVLAGEIRMIGPRQPILRVYIEGDGFGYVSPTQLSSNPTPYNPVGLELAAADPSPAVLYLGRPCQYVTPPEARSCEPRYWSTHRFAPEVIDATNQAIAQALAWTGTDRVVLIGYSGGGAVAALVAARRSDVVAWVTVAAPLDHDAWTRRHAVAPLNGSLNPIDDAQRLAGLPQMHFVGAKDEVVPPEIPRRFLEREGAGAENRLVVVPGFDHVCCWVARWPELRTLIPALGPP